VVFYLTGQTGSVTPLNTAPSGPLTPQALLPIAVTIGGKAAPVAFYGEAPLMVVGVLQVNAQVPDGLPSGNHPLVVSFGGIGSPGGVTVAVR
jgi:uncharacterized protein (TIGR03437 family)